MIKIATMEDFALIRSMSIKFLEATDYKKYYNENKMDLLITDWLKSDNNIKIALLHGEDGMIGGCVNPFLFGNILTATEIAWWVEPEKRKTKVGKELLEAFEFWAKKVGCALIVMISIDDSLGYYYEKNGYKLFERSYMKEI